MGISVFLWTKDKDDACSRNELCPVPALFVVESFSLDLEAALLHFFMLKAPSVQT